MTTLSLSKLKPSELLTSLEDLLAASSSIVIALSGGIDSSLLAVAVKRVMDSRDSKESYLAVTAISPSLSKNELDNVAHFCKDNGIAWRSIYTNEHLRPQYQQNNPDRCYYCKDTLFAALNKLAAEHGFLTVVEGTHAADLKGHRPGHRASKEHQILSPYVVLGWGKEEIRRVAKHIGLNIANKVSSPCLASRLAYGVKVTPERLQVVSKAEDLIRELTGIAKLRVRLHESIARIEILPKEFPKFMSHAETIANRLSALGITYVTLDLQGYRPGSLLEVINNTSF